MKWIEDNTGEITESAYSLSNGRIILKIQYRSRTKGFLVCVSEIFAEEPDLQDETLLQKVGDCMKKSGNKCSYTYEGKEYQFFYVDEEKVRMQDSQLPLPSTVKAPAKINILWMDGERNLHRDKTGEIIIPISIKVEMKRYKKGFFKKEYFCNMEIGCLSASNMGDAVLCYRVHGNTYPIPRQVVTGRMPIVIKTQDENTGITVDVFPEYKHLYKLQINN